MDRRKELIRQYKETAVKRGVFQIRNRVNGKTFVKSSMNLQTLNGQIFQLEQGSHKNKALQADWNEYGKDAFAVEILEELDEKDHFPTLADALTRLEQKWLDKLAPYDLGGYNLRSKEKTDKGEI